MTEERRSLAPNREVLDPMQMGEAHTRGALVPADMGQALELAKVMSTGRFAVPSFLNGNAGDCLRLVMISTRTGLDPFMLANEAYCVENRGEKRMDFMAKAIHAIVLASGVLDGGLDAKVEGDGDNMRCTISGKRVGGAPQTETYHIRNISPKNSPLWKTQPRQQLIYYSERAWCRLHAPDAIMGLVAREDPPLQAPASNGAAAPASDLEKVEQHLGVEDDAVTDADFEEVNGNAETEQAEEQPASNEAAGSYAPPADGEQAKSEAEAQDDADYVNDLLQRIEECLSKADLDQLMNSQAKVIATLGKPHRDAITKAQQKALKAIESGA